MIWNKTGQHQICVLNKIKSAKTLEQWLKENILDFQRKYDINFNSLICKVTQYYGQFMCIRYLKIRILFFFQNKSTRDKRNTNL